MQFDTCIIRTYYRFLMEEKGKILSVRPPYALPGGEIEIEADLSFVEPGSTVACTVGSRTARIIAASKRRVLAEVPPAIRAESTVDVTLGYAGERTAPAELHVAGLLAEDMHLVANPAVDPTDDSVILTRSGTRGQQLPKTLFRLETDGYLDEMPVEVLNPTAVAFGPDGALYTTNRAEGIVYRIDRGEEAVPVARGLGIATGLAFDRDGVMYVGDRSGTIYRILSDGTPDEFTKLEPSVAAYHLAFGPAGHLFVTAPGLASFEGVVEVDPNGGTEPYFRGLGRPQGIAFDNEGTLYAAACSGGRRGIFRIEYHSGKAEHFVAGNNIVGLCFNSKGDLLIATNDSLFTLPVGIKGALLNPHRD